MTTTVCLFKNLIRKIQKDKSIMKGEKKNRASKQLQCITNEETRQNQRN